MLRRLSIAIIFAASQITPSWGAFNTPIGTSQLPAALALGNFLSLLPNVKAYGAIGDGNSHPLSNYFSTLAAAQAVYPAATALTQEIDWAAIQKAVNVAIAAKLPAVKVPGSSGYYRTTTTITEDMTVAGAAPVSLIGDGKITTGIKSTGLAGPVVAVTAPSSGQTAYFSVRGLTLTGDNTSGSIGLQIKAVAYTHLSDFLASAFTYGLDETDSDQSQIEASELRYNTNGARFNAPVCCTGSNSVTFVNTNIGNNTTTGLTMTSGGLLMYTGGSIQYNGATGGGATNYGVKLNDMTSATFVSTDFEGNGGNASLDINNTTVPGLFKVIGAYFLRTNSFGAPYNVAVNDILAEGSQAQTISVETTRFFSSGGYTPTASNKDINLSNTSAKAVDLGSNIFQDAVEAPSWAGRLKLPGTDATSYSPTVTCSTSGPPTYTTDMYTSRVGGMVYVGGRVLITALNGCSGTLSTSLPYALPSGVIVAGSGINLSSGAGLTYTLGTGSVLQSPAPAAAQTLSYGLWYPSAN